MSRREFKGTALTRYLFGLEDAKQINTRPIDNQPWYVAREICRQVGIVGYSHAVNGERSDDFELKKSERRHASIHIGNYGKNNMLMVNNGGMLKLIYQSNTPAALDIQDRISEIPADLFPDEWHEYMTEIDN